MCAISKHKPNAIAHLGDSIYIGTQQSGRLIKVSDQVDERSTSWGRFISYDNSWDSLRRNTNSGYWPESNSYEYPIGWAQGKDIELPTKSKKRIPITAMLTIPEDIYEGTGLQQRVNQLRRNRQYFANGGRQEKGEVIPLKKVA